MNEDFKTLKRVMRELAQLGTLGKPVDLITDDEFNSYSKLLFEKQELIHRIYYDVHFYADYNTDSVIH